MAILRPYILKLVAMVVGVLQVHVCALDLTPRLSWIVAGDVGNNHDILPPSSNLCLTLLLLPHDGMPPQLVVGLSPCLANSNNQLWLYDSQSLAIVNNGSSSNLCLDAAADQLQLLVSKCNHNASQMWVVDPLNLRTKTIRLAAESSAFYVHKGRLYGQDINRLSLNSSTNGAQNFTWIAYTYPIKSKIVKAGGQTGSRSGRPKWIIPVIVSLLTIVAAVFVVCMGWLFARKYSRNKNAVTTSSDTRPCTEQAMHQKFSWEEIEKVTENFRLVIGEGGFSRVYRGVLADQTVCAVKVQTRKNERLRQAFHQELHALLRVRDANLVNLLGYCDEREREEGVLVFEYVSNGNLHEKLHADESGQFLPWPRRTAIAFQIASALEYLHELCNPPILHCDVKSSNILLDDNYNAKLCDFGFCKTGDKNLICKNSSVMGSPGYFDLHCLKSGIISKKSDVFSFGVLLLELITGMEAFCGEKRELLAVVASPFFKDSKKLCEIVDCRLNGNGFQSKQAESMARIAAMCIGGDPESRPSMTEIMRLMNENC